MRDAAERHGWPRELRIPASWRVALVASIAPKRDFARAGKLLRLLRSGLPKAQSRALIRRHSGRMLVLHAN